MERQLGRKKAIVAVGRKLLVAVWRAAGADGRPVRRAETGGLLAVCHGLQGRCKGHAGWTDATNLHIGSAGPAGAGIRGFANPMGQQALSVASFGTTGGCVGRM